MLHGCRLDGAKAERGGHCVMLNEFEQNTVTLAEKMMSEDEEKMESVVENCKALSKQIGKLSLGFETVISSKRVRQLYIIVREAESEVKTLLENLGKLEEANVVRTFTFEPSGLMSLLRSPDVLGTISHQYQQVRTSRPVTTRDTSSITARKLANVSVRSSSDFGNCRITGSAVVSNKRQIITDWDNFKVKLLDTHTNKIFSELKLATQPWDITVVSMTKAAVALPIVSKILIINISPSLAQEREITVRGRCCGVAYTQDRLLVTFDDNPRLEIIDLRGNVIRTIENGNDGSKLFARPKYVCVSRDGETFYVSDFDRSTVTSLTCDGVVKAVYNNKELSDPGKVRSDHDGNVYVCGWSSKNVHMITGNCKKIKVILTQADGLNSAVLSVSHCQDTQKLFIGMVGDEVNVYQLS